MARLATADKTGKPHCVPVCFIEHDGRFYIPLDEKPKRVEARRLKRVRNVLENPRVTLLVDHWDEDWSKLWFVMVEARAELVELKDAQREKLAEKYPQYRKMQLEWALELTTERTARWQGR